LPRQPGFWSVEERLKELSARGDPLEELQQIVDFELFSAGARDSGRTDPRAVVHRSMRC
jgi:hypothetical protein